MGEGLWTWRRPLMVAGLTAFAASLLCLWIPWWMGLVLAGICLVLTVCLFRYYNMVFVLFFGAVFLIAGSVYVWQQVEPVTATAGREDCLTGNILDNTGNRYTLTVTQATYVPVGSRVLLHIADLSAPQVGDTVRASVRVQALSAAQTYRRSDGVFISAYPVGYDEEAVHVLVSGDTGGGLTAFRQALKKRLDEHLPGEEGALLTAVCLGDTGGLSDEVYEAFRASGLTHLLVVSGLHLTMVSGSVLSLLRLCRLRRWLAVLLTMAVTMVFMLFMGLSPSVVRAGVMCLVMLAGSLLRRPADPLNSMGLALMLLLFFNPYATTDIGLLLSFVATGGVIVLLPPLYAGMTAFCGESCTGLKGVACGFWKSIAAGLAACVSALLLITPVLIGFFGSFSLSAPVANLLAVIPAGWCLLMGWITLLLLSIPLTPMIWLGEGMMFLTAMPARWLIWVARQFSGKGSQAYTPYVWQGVVVIALCIGLALLICPPTYLPRRVLVAFLAFLLVAASLGVNLERGVTNLWVYPNGKGTALLLKQDDHVALLATHSEALYQGALAVKDIGAPHMELVVVGQSVSANAGQLAGLLQQRKAAVVYTTATANWTAGLARQPTHVPLGETLQLWEGVTLLIDSDNLWVLQVNDCTLHLAVGEDGLTISGQEFCLVMVADSSRYRLTLRAGGIWHSRVW